MKAKPRAIVLGGTNPHIALINKLQERGYYVILIDYFDNPPARAYSDEHIIESNLDRTKVLHIAKQIDAKIVLSPCLDHQNAVACYVAEELGLPKLYSYETALNVSNKALMKKKMIDNEIPTSKYFHLKDTKDLNKHDLNFPVIVKPVDSNGSKGVRKACNYSELSKHLLSALQYSDRNEAIIEEYIEGKEVGVDCFVKNKEVFIIMIKDRHKIKQKDCSIQQIYGCTWPADINANNKTRLLEIAKKIAKVFDLNNTPLMIQAVIDKDDISIIEIAARIGGGESQNIIKRSTKCDLLDAVINTCLGNKIELDYEQPKSFYADRFIYTKQGNFSHIYGYDILLRNHVIDDIVFYKTSGMTVGLDLTSNNRVGAFVVKSHDKHELNEKINTAIENIEAFNTYGQPIMRKDVYSH
jgi:biotin carboxylase